jgi:hypothetical protein
MNNTSLEQLNDKLEDVYINLADVQGTQINAVTQQTNMKSIIDTEKTRLLAKQATIDQAVDNQKRIIYFNDNSRKIALSYLNILITIAITLGMVYFVRVIFNYFTKLPDMLFNILIVTIVSLGIIITYRCYKGIIKRNPYNFDELNLSAPKMHISSSTEGGNIGKLGNITGCVGYQCCTPATAESPGTKWSENQGKCIFAAAGSNVSVLTTPPITTIPEQFSLMSERQVPSYSPQPSYSSN